MGLAATLELARRGHQVVASMRDTGRARRLLDAAQAARVDARIEVATLDVTAPAAELEATVARIAVVWGGIDVLVNNAGTAGVAPAERLTDAEWHRTFATNVFGPMACIRAVLPGMRKQRAETIINVVEH